MSIGEKIYNLRIKAKVSQENMALDLGVSRQAVSKWETDQSIPDLENLKMIASYFNVSLSSLIDDQVKEIKVKEEDIHSTKKTYRASKILLIIASSLALFTFVIFSLIIILQNPLKILFGLDGFTNNELKLKFVFPIIEFITLFLLIAFIIVMSLNVIKKQNKKDRNIVLEILAIALLIFIVCDFLILPRFNTILFKKQFNDVAFAISYNNLNYFINFIEPLIVLTIITYVVGISFSLISRVINPLGYKSK